MATKITSFRRLCLVGGLAVVVSTIANLIIRIIGLNLLKVPPQFVPIGIGPVIFWSVVAGSIAVLVFYLVTRLAQQPLLIYVFTAFLVYVCTFIPDGLLLTHNPPIIPGTTASGVVVLMAMHATEATIILLTLVVSGRPKTHL